ncbi:hypothetical protein Aperf_G00000013589 [Anoplocephala perfoliata]
MAALKMDYIWPRDTGYCYSLWAFASFIGVVCINHFIGEPVFERLFPVYQNLSPRKKLEWNSRVSSTLHACLVIFLTSKSLLFDKAQWLDPVASVSRPGCIALAITTGYMLADTITMITFQKGLELFLFTIHHVVVAICFTFVLSYRLAPLFGILRLTSEISTPFLNQRWFYWTIGGDNADKRAASATLVFTALFIIGRFILPFFYWYVFWVNFNSKEHLALKPSLPFFTNYLISLPVLLDVLNVAWGFPVCGIAKRALTTLGYIQPIPKPEQKGPSIHNGRVHGE